MAELFLIYPVLKCKLINQLKHLGHTLVWQHIFTFFCLFLFVLKCISYYVLNFDK